MGRLSQKNLILSLDQLCPHVRAAERAGWTAAGGAATGGETTVPESRLHNQADQRHQCIGRDRGHW